MQKGSHSASDNFLFGELVVRALVALGIKHFIVSPGSRSSPLTMAMQCLGKDQHTVVLDERSAAFQALGRIKATRSPVALICTSGSAAAHYYPAVIEARETGLPLVVLTADRPPELHNCHAGQTIDQSKIFGTYPVFQVELPLPEEDTLLFRQVRETCRVAVEAAQGLPGGPVHLNCPFREPFFVKDEDRTSLDLSLIEGLREVRKSRSSTDFVPQLPGRTLILAGPRPGIDAAEEVNALISMSKRNGWPILADASNPIRFVAESSAQVIAHYDRVARDEDLWNSLKPEAIIQWGEPPTSKVLRQQISNLDLTGYLISDSKKAINPTHGKTEWVCSNAVDFESSCIDPSDDYLSLWKDAEERMERLLGSQLEQPHALFEGDIHRSLATILPESSILCFANSLAIRDAEWFMPHSGKGFIPFSQRGANGIDGTISLARGIAMGAEKPVYLVTGDLAFLHDTNGLLGGQGEESGVFIIVINNQGGGIFELLPVARRCEDFEELFATPQNIDLSLLVKANGGDYRLHLDLDSFEQHVSEWNGRGLVVAEIKVDRKKSAQLHRRFLKLQEQPEDLR